MFSISIFVFVVVGMRLNCIVICVVEVAAMAVADVEAMVAAIVRRGAIGELRRNPKATARVKVNVWHISEYRLVVVWLLGFTTCNCKSFAHLELMVCKKM